MIDWSTILTVLIFLGWANCMAFILGYQWKTGGSWSRYPMGRHLMFLSVSLGVTFTMLALDRMWDLIGTPGWVFGVAFVVMVLTQRTWMLFTRRWRSQGSDYTEDTRKELRR